MERPWWIVGCGRMGRTLGQLAGRLGVEVQGTWNRTEEAARRCGAETPEASRHFGSLAAIAENVVWPEDAVVWLTVVDDAVASTAAALADAIPESALVMHCCGSLGADVLREAGIRGPVGSVHPSLAITEPERAVERLAEVTWSVEGDAEAVRWATAFLECFGAPTVELERGARPLYHASAVTAANLLVALMDAAFEMAEQAGIPPDQARSILVPLARSSLDNVAAQPPEEALSGPAARGDDGTIEGHRRALEALGDENLEELYRVLMERARRLGDAED